MGRKSVPYFGDDKKSKDCCKKLTAEIAGGDPQAGNIESTLLDRFQVRQDRRDLIGLEDEFRHVEMADGETFSQCLGQSPEWDTCSIAFCARAGTRRSPPIGWSLSWKSRRGHADLHDHSSGNCATAAGGTDMSDTLQALLDSGALYLALGAVICIALGIGAARRLFQGASKINGSQRRKD
jgi:hypothetical protein